MKRIYEISLAVVITFFLTLLLSSSIFGGKYATKAELCNLEEKLDGYKKHTEQVYDERNEVICADIQELKALVMEIFKVLNQIKQAGQFAILDHLAHNNLVDTTRTSKERSEYADTLHKLRKRY